MIVTAGHEAQRQDIANIGSISRLVRGASTRIIRLSDVAKR